MERGTVRNVEFYSKNKFEKLVHLVGFIIRIYHDAPSPERQNVNITCECLLELHTLRSQSKHDFYYN